MTNNKAKRKEAKAYQNPALLRRKRQWRNRIISSLLLIALGCGAVGLKHLSSQAQERADKSSQSVQQEMLTAEMENTEMTDKLMSAGTLASAKESSLQIPGTVSVSYYYVKVGDIVSAGDPIAILDRDSVLAAISENESLVASLDARLNEMMDEEEESDLKAKVAGTIIRIYAEEGESVVNAMYDHGALMLVSLDGLYAVDISNEKLQDGEKYGVGDSLTVKGSNGASCSGIVSAVTKDTITVTVPIDDFELGEEVQVAGSNGMLASGSLYINSQQKITAYSGNISSINVEEGETVAEEDSFMTLTGVDYTADYQFLLTQRNCLVDQYNTLVALADHGILYADSDGMITDIDETLLTGSTASGEAQATTLMAGNTFRAEGKTYLANAASMSTLAVITVASAETEEPAVVSEEALTAGEPEAPPAAETEAPSHAEESTDTPPESTEKPEQPEESERPEQPEGENEPSEDPDAVVTKSVVIQWVDEKENAITEGIPDEYEVTLLADGKEVEKVKVLKKEDWTYKWERLPVYNGALTISYTINCQEPDGYKGSFKLVEDTIYLIFTRSSGEGIPGGEGRPDGTGEDTPSGSGSMPSGSGSMPSGSGSMPSGSGSMMSGGSFSGGSSSGSGFDSGSMSAYYGTGNGTVAMGMEYGDVQNSDTFVQNTTTVGVIIPNDEVCIEIVIDELDIRKIDIGTEVEVVLDAIPGETYVGVITGIDTTGTNSGGNTKYTATVTMEKNENMLLGMNASITIYSGETKDVMYVPAAALIEEKGKTYVYTGYDEKTGDLTGKTEVTTGLSDGTNVEIVDGLHSGDTVYYMYADAITFQFMR